THKIFQRLDALTLKSSKSLVCVFVSVCGSDPPSPQAGLLLDVDGVLVRGGSVLPAARRAVLKLVDRKRRFVLPVVFVTNAGSCQRDRKAQQLSDLLHAQVSPDQVVLSYMCVQINVLGFHRVLSIDQLVEQHPLLDMVDHNRRPETPQLPAIEAIVLFGEPIRWETSLQLLTDVLLSHGRPGLVHAPQPGKQLPVLACNTDLLWMAEAPCHG
uniref:Haloacid dehalogenase like hydrolase domain containing 5 n=1 Tax=Gouania willdenowi TaxID=441366 RepID=A0A8C5ELD0_GOUWI